MSLTCFQSVLRNTILPVSSTNVKYLYYPKATGAVLGSVNTANRVGLYCNTSNLVTSSKTKLTLGHTFTIEFFLFNGPDTISNVNGIVSYGRNATNGRFQVNYGNVNGCVQIFGSVPNLNSLPLPINSTNVWNHFAFVVNVGKLSVYKNGVLIHFSDPSFNMIDLPSPLVLFKDFYGANGGLVSPTRVTNIRITKKAVYTGNFSDLRQLDNTPSILPLTQTALETNIQSIDAGDVSLLLQFNTNPTNQTGWNAIDIAGTITSWIPYTASATNTNNDPTAISTFPTWVAL